MGKPVGERRFRVLLGQYALRLRSDVPTVVQLGRADVRQANLAYYTTMGYAL